MSKRQFKFLRGWYSIYQKERLPTLPFQRWYQEGATLDLKIESCMYVVPTYVHMYLECGQHTLFNFPFLLPDLPESGITWAAVMRLGKCGILFFDVNIKAGSGCIGTPCGKRNIWKPSSKLKYKSSWGLNCIFPIALVITLSNFPCETKSRSTH
jgi:hypothetical protein